MTRTHVGSNISAKGPLARAFGCGALAVLLAAVAMIRTVRNAGWSLTALAHVDSQTKLGALAKTLDPGFHTVHPGAYDGQFYWGVTIDPLATGSAHEAFDKASYRYGHPLYGWLAWLLSAGHAQAAPAALATVGLASIFAAATLAAMLGLGRGRAGWEGLFVACNPGLISSVSNDLAEPLATALLLASFTAYVRGRRGALWFCFALLPLAKEPLMLVLAAVVAWELGHNQARRAATLATAAIPALMWWSYARIHLGAWFTSGDTAIGPPLAGWRAALIDAGSNAHHSSWQAAGTVAALVSLLALATLTSIRASRQHSPAGYSYLALAALAACLAPNATRAISTALRNTAFLVTLVPFVIASPALLRGAVADRRPNTLISP